MKTARGLVLLLPVVSLMLVPVSPATAQNTACLPDLVIESIVVNGLPGIPPYIRVDSRGVASGFDVAVVTKNRSNCDDTKFSRTNLVFLSSLQKLHVHGTSARVPPIKAHHSHTSVFKVQGLQPPLGWLFVQAQADWARTVKESNELNNVTHWQFTWGRRHQHAQNFIPVIADKWKAIVFRITDNVGQTAFPGASEVYTTQAYQDLEFDFSTFDESKQEFEYYPSGQIQTMWDFSYPPANCTGHAGTIVPQKQWPGHFSIDGDLLNYDGFVDTSGGPLATGAIYCNGQPILPAQVRWQNLDTFIAPKVFPGMQSSDTQLSDQTIQTGPGGDVTTWSWTFQADVPGA